MPIKNISGGLAQVQFGYQNAVALNNSTDDASIDRARGGIMRIKLTIPERTYECNRKDIGDTVTIPTQTCTFEIDLELMPLVNVSAYCVQETQNAPDTLPYPNGVKNPYTGEFIL